jgi:hypothetical protein
MFGGLRHRNMKRKAEPLVGDRSRNQASYSGERTQCPCTAGSSLAQIMKFITANTLTGPAYLEMLKKSLRLTGGIEQKRVRRLSVQICKTM